MLIVPSTDDILRNGACVLIQEALDEIGYPFLGWCDADNITLKSIQKYFNETKKQSLTVYRKPYERLIGEHCVRDRTAEHLERIAWFMRKPARIFKAGPICIEAESCLDSGQYHQSESIEWGDGHHRASAIVALGWPAIPITFSGSYAVFRKYFQKSYRKRLYRLSTI